MKSKGLIFIISCCLIAAAAGCGDSSGKKHDANDTAKTKQESPAETKNTEPPKLFDSSAAFEKYSSHPFISLWDTIEEVPFNETSVSKTVPKLIPYIAENNTNGGCVIIFPGGGYVQLAIDKEGKAPAEELNKNNITAFVLQYRVNSYEHDAIMADAFRAIRYVRANADEFGIDPDKIGVMGFSAGGHLAAMSLQHYDEDTQSNDEIDKASAKPDYGILCYPVISLKDEKTHELTRQTFLGKDNISDEALIKKYSGEDNVTKDMPPVFIWHCEPDTAVPVENSKDFAKAMDKAKVPYEMHIYKTGSHGLGLAKDNEEVCEWFPNCIEWLQKYGY